ncbi:glycosyltransferase family 4 protein [Acuticoccus sp. I52.16.1]|uniref:glycosyltransferase family 4 protein n=1 Tax=Acuticoccus sp. I52.16.1 TaxID=2928472 RepID=UPI001FD3EAF0|nr:glycosyltransferase family 4 protein [Acuticoccus sp. I52.16.1]UOM33378.1 glycosyltransferase family 4 protein [Acuticoccus sp. I52.16.1]
MTARPMTILQVVPQLETGGAERTTLDVAAALVADGDRAIVVSEGGRMLPELEAMGAEHVTMPVASKNPLTMRRNAARLAAIMEAEAVDIIHARSRAPAWSALWAASWTYRPLVTTYHGAYNEASFLKNYYNSVMARGDVVIANSAFTAGLVAARHPFARDRIVTIHRGIDLSAFDAPASERAEALRRSWNVDRRDRVILNLARLTPWKGQLVLIDALAQVREKLPTGWVCVLAGDDQGRTDYHRELEDRIRFLGLEKRVRLVGHVSDVPAALAGASIAVQPSIEPEAFGRAAVEAQAAGVPVIVSDLGAVRETVLSPPDVARDVRTGWRVAAGEVAPLADALFQALLSSGETLREIGERGKAHAFTHFSLLSMTQKTLAVYDDLLENAKTTLY